MKCNPINRITSRFVRPNVLFLFALGTAAFLAPLRAPAQQTGEAVQVEVEQVRKRPILAKEVKAHGIANPDGVTRVWRSEIPVRILKVLVRQGQRVEAGDVILTIDPTSLRRAEALAEICKAGASRLEQAARNLAAQADAPDSTVSTRTNHRFGVSISLWDMLFGGGAEYDYQSHRETVTVHSPGLAAERRVRAEDIIVASTTEAMVCDHRLQDALTGLAEISLRVQHDAIVHEVYAKVGDQIQRGTPLVTVGHEASVEVVAYLDGPDYQQTPYLSRCTVDFDAHPGTGVPCLLTRRNPRLLGDTAVVGEVAAQLLGAPPIGVFKDMLGVVSIEVYGDPVRALPVNALVHNPNGALGAWVVQEDSTLAFRRVSLGGQADEQYVQILRGIEPGEHVVRGGPTTLARLKAGDRVDPHPWLPDGASPDDRQLVHDIAVVLGADAWLDDLGELLPVPLSELPGVSATDGTVVEIDLRGEAVAGWMAPQIGQLSGLRRLDLGDNLIFGDIPPSLGALSHLEFLALDGNPLMFGALPSSMKALRLDSLILRGTALCVPQDAALQAWEDAVRTSDAPTCEPPTGSGFSYQVLVESDGPKPDATDGVWINYTSTLLEGTGTLVASSPGKRIRLTPDGTTEVVELLPGIREAIPLIPMGGKIRVIIPPDLAHGTMGKPGASVYPNATLVHEIELLEIMHPCLSGRPGHRHHVDQARITWWPCPGVRRPRTPREEGS